LNEGLSQALNTIMRNWINLFEQQLNEATMLKVTLPQKLGAKEVMVWKNPSLHEVQVLVVSNIMRGLVDDVNVYIWKSNDAIHDSMTTCLANAGYWQGETFTLRAGTPNQSISVVTKDTTEAYFYDPNNSSQSRWVNYDDELPYADLADGLRMSAYTKDRFKLDGMPAMLKRLFRKVPAMTEDVSKFRSRDQIAQDAMNDKVHLASHMGELNSTGSIDWVPTYEQIATAEDVGQAWYSSYEEYSADQFVDDFSLSDPDTDLSQEMLNDLYEYGEFAEWENMTVRGFVRFNKSM
jgi:hypothetical protein